MSLAPNNIKTPYLIIDKNKIEENFDSLKMAFPKATIFYALKANANKEIVKTLQKIGCSFEVNSPSELTLLKSLKVPNSAIINSSPVKSKENISVMQKSGVNRMAFDSLEELEKIKTIAPKSKLYLRIHTSNTGSGQELNTKFGCSFEDAPKLLKRAFDAGLAVFGLTFSVGSQCENLENWEEGLKKCASLFAKFPLLTTIDIGGGFPIPFSNTTLTIKDISKALMIYINKYFAKSPILFLEPGRFLVGNSGTTVASVIGIKNHSSPRWAFVDVSVFGGFLEVLEFKKGLRYPVSCDKKGKLYSYNIAGPTCDGCDIIIRDVMLPELEVGDRIYFGNTGTYTLEYASPFNGYPIPKIYFR